MKRLWLRGELATFLAVGAVGLAACSAEVQSAGREPSPGRAEVAKRGWVLWAEPLPRDAGLRVAWWGAPGEKVEVWRAESGRTNFARLLEAQGVESYEDRGIEMGRRYVYRVQSGARPAVMELVAGVRLPPIENRGTIGLLVDETLASALRPELSRLERELMADGWRVIRRDVSRHDDRDWSRNTNAIARIREQVRKDWETTGGALRCLYLIGHVAIPYSGMRAEDLHTGPGDNHWGAWPADMVYADIDGLWTDREPYPTFLAPVRFAATRNDPGDGKFDTEHVPPNAAGDARMEMAFGRVDFHGMPAFGRGERGEIELLRQYLDKVRRYRLGTMPARPAAVARGYFRNGEDYGLLSNAYRLGSRMFEGGPRSVEEGDLFNLSDGDAVAWGFQSAGGAIDRIRVGAPDVVTSSRLANPKRQARVLFTMLLGSWFGDWAVGENNLLRAITASRDHGLAAMWVRTADWRLDVMGLGGTLGDGQLLTANESVRYLDPNHGTTRTLTLLGDPTLRLHVVAPVRGLRGKREAGGVRLTWAEGGRDILGWHVYSGEEGGTEPFRRLTSELLTRREFVDSEPRPGRKYLVRAAQLATSGSGSYTNLSLGVFWP